MTSLLSKILVLVWVATVPLAASFGCMIVISRVVPEANPFMERNLSFGGPSLTMMIAACVALQPFLMFLGCVSLLVNLTKPQKHQPRVRQTLVGCLILSFVTLAPTFLPFDALEAPLLLVRPINSPFKGYWMAEAASQQSLVGVRILVWRGSSADVVGELDRYPLISPAYGGSIEMIDLLLANGARVNRPNELGITPLVAAIEANQIPAARRLLRAGADPTVRLTNGRPLLDVATAASPEAAAVVREAFAEWSKRTR